MLARCFSLRRANEERRGSARLTGGVRSVASVRGREGDAVSRHFFPASFTPFGARVSAGVPCSIFLSFPNGDLTVERRIGRTSVNADNFPTKEATLLPNAARLTAFLPLLLRILPMCKSGEIHLRASRPYAAVFPLLCPASIFLCRITYMGMRTDGRGADGEGSGVALRRSVGRALHW